MNEAIPLAACFFFCFRLLMLYYIRHLIKNPVKNPAPLCLCARLLRERIVGKFSRGGAETAEAQLLRGNFSRRHRGRGEELGQAFFPYTPCLCAFVRGSCARIPHGGVEARRRAGASLLSAPPAPLCLCARLLRENSSQKAQRQKKPPRRAAFAMLSKRARGLAPCRRKG
jgi:hypothetical protein